jgi:hypothetical protein
MSLSFSRVFVVVATLAAATPAPKELAGAIEIYDTAGNDAVADRAYIEERHLECLSAWPGTSSHRGRQGPD